MRVEGVFGSRMTGGGFGEGHSQPAKQMYGSKHPEIKFSAMYERGRICFECCTCPAQTTSREQQTVADQLASATRHQNRCIVVVKSKTASMLYTRQGAAFLFRAERQLHVAQANTTVRTHWQRSACVVVIHASSCCITFTTVVSGVHIVNKTRSAEQYKL